MLIELCGYHSLTPNFRTSDHPSAMRGAIYLVLGKMSSSCVSVPTLSSPPVLPLFQTQHGYRDIPELTTEEQNIIEREHTHRWSHPMTLYLTIALCSIGAAVQGWDQTGSNGANLSFPLEFGIAGGGRDTWLVGVVNAAPYLASAGLGCW